MIFTEKFCPGKGLPGGMPGGCWRLELTYVLIGNEVVSPLYSFHGYGGYDVIFLNFVEEGSKQCKNWNDVIPVGEYEQITPSHLFKSVNHTYIILTLDTAYQTKDKSCKFDTGTATARCIIKFGKNLFNFVCRAVAAFVSARRGKMYKLGVMMIKVGILDQRAQ